MTNNNIILTLNKQLNSFKKDIEKLNEMLSAYSKGKSEELTIFKKIIQLNEKYPANPLITARLLEFLQLVNNEKLLELFTLEDLGRLYVNLSNIFKDDVDLHIECYHYLSKIIGNDKQASKFIQKFSKNVTKRLSAV